MQLELSSRKLRIRSTGPRNADSTPDVYSPSAEAIPENAIDPSLMTPIQRAELEAQIGHEDCSAK